MNKHALITAVLGILVLGLALDDMRLRARVGELEMQLESAQAELEAVPVRPAPTAAPPVRSKARRATPGEGRGGGLGSAELPEDPEARKEARQEQFRAELDLYLDEFGAEHELNEATLAELDGMVVATMSEVSGLWEQTRSGDLDRTEVRGRMEELRVELELDLAERLGAAEAEAFVAGMPGPLGSERPHRPGGR